MTDWTYLDGDATAQIDALLDGMTAVTRYQKRRGMLDSALAGGYEGWRDPTPVDEARETWRSDASHLHVHSAKYTVSEDRGVPHCTIRATASAEDDVVDGERVDDPYGIQGTILIRGTLPTDVDGAEYVEELLG